MKKLFPIKTYEINEKYYLRDTSLTLFLLLNLCFQLCQFLYHSIFHFASLLILYQHFPYLTPTFSLC